MRIELFGPGLREEVSAAMCSIPGVSSMDRTGSAGMDPRIKEMQKGIHRDGYMIRNENSISGESDRSDIEDSRSCFPGSRLDSRGTAHNRVCCESDHSARVRLGRQAEGCLFHLYA